MYARHLNMNSHTPMLTISTLFTQPHWNLLCTACRRHDVNLNTYVCANTHTLHATLECFRLSPGGSLGAHCCANHAQHTVQSSQPLRNTHNTSCLRWQFATRFLTDYAGLPAATGWWKLHHAVQTFPHLEQSWVRCAYQPHELVG